MRDIIRFDYIDLNASGTIALERPILYRTTEPNRVVRLGDNTAEYVDRLMKARPRWQFICQANYYPGDNPLTVKELSVYEEGVNLGRIWVEHDWRTNEPRYCYTSPRQRKAASDNRGKRGSSYSTKIPTAVKGILKMFYLPTPAERIAEAASKIHVVSGSHLSTAMGNLNRAQSQIQRAAYERALEDWDAIRGLLNEDVAAIDLPAIVNAREEAGHLATAVSAGHGRIVRIESNGSYLVGRRLDNNYAMVVYDDANLPDKLRTNLGLLKMVENDTALPGIGVRVDAATFFIVLEGEE